MKKKLLSLVLTIITCLCLSTPVSASTAPNNSLGLFIFSDNVKLDYSKVASAMFAAWKKR